MLVYKFGGASVRSAEGIKNLAEIVSKESENLVIVVSAFGKTTNSLERVVNSWTAGDDSWMIELVSLRDYHLATITQLFGSDSAVESLLAESFNDLIGKLHRCMPGDYDHDYDMVVSMGEVWSTIVVEAYLRYEGFKSRWVDIRGLFLTDERYRDANIIWDDSLKRVSEAFSFRDSDIYVTQGFIGATSLGESTTLGREGSDYTAAVIANMIDACRVVVWKDVPGIMNADPKWLPGAETLQNISYNEAVEMTFSGAKVIHPKTIKPLHNKNIPLHVRSFIDFDVKGTVISSDSTFGDNIPIFVRKESQILITVFPKDLSFAIGENLASVFHLFEKCGVKVNMVQAGAVKIDVCADDDRPHIENVIEELGKEFNILYNEGVEMLTIRHYRADSAAIVTGNREVLISQSTRASIRFVVRAAMAGSETQQ